MARHTSTPKWLRTPKTSFSSKDLSRRFKKAETASVRHARRFLVKRWKNVHDVRRQMATWGVIIGVLIGAIGLQAWWTQQGYRTTASASGGTYAEAVIGPVKTLNPIFAESSAEQSAAELLFSRLLKYDTTGNLNFDLASSMKISDDEKSYTLTIRPDARWSDGMYVTAKDVAYTVGLVQNSATRATVTGWDGVKVTTQGERTVTFTLPAVYAAFPHALQSLSILPEHVLRDVEPSRLRENSFSTAPVGSGPYVLKLLQEVSATDGRSVVHLAGNPLYYGGRSKLSRVQLHVYKDADTVKTALQQSEVNAATDVSVTTANELSTKGFTVENIPVNSGVYALLNTSSSALKDQKVRQALQHGTDTRSLRASLSKDIPALYLPFIARQVSGELPEAPAYDQKRAAALLDEAGWKLDGSVRKKDGQPLSLTIVTTKNPDFEKVLDTLSSQWNALGITITTSVVDPNDTSQNIAQNVLQPRRYDVLLYQLAIGGDPDVYAYWHSSQITSGFNLSNYKNIISDEALLSARTKTNPALRSAKYITFAKQWLNDVPAIGLYQTTMQYVHTSNVQSISSSTTLVSSTDRFENVLDWTVRTRSVFKTP